VICVDSSIIESLLFYIVVECFVKR